MASAPKRRLLETELKGNPLEEDQDDDVIFLAKHEPENVKLNHLVKLLIGKYEQLCTRMAIQDMLPDPSYFQSTVSSNGNECRLIIPDEIDAWAVNVVLLAALNEGVPLNCKSAANGLTPEKLHQAAAFLKVDGSKIGLPARQTQKMSAVSGQQGENNIRPESQENPDAVSQPAKPQLQSNETVDTEAVLDLQYNLGTQFKKPRFLNLSLATVLNLVKKGFCRYSEYIAYEALLKWSKHDFPSRWTKEICDILFAEIRWDSMQYQLEHAIKKETSPLRDTLLDLQTAVYPSGRLTAAPRSRGFTERLYLFFSDGNQVVMWQYDWAVHKSWLITLPREMKHWTTYCDIACGMDSESIVFRVVNNHHLKTYSYGLISNKVRYLFEQQTNSGEGYPIVCLDGTIYAWDFKTKGSKHNLSLKFHPDYSAVTHDVKKPKFFRKNAAFASWHGKFYYCGGILISDKSGAAVATVEMYDASKDKWTTLPNMQHPRRCFAAMVCDGFLYVTGGAVNDETGVHKSCERLNLSLHGAKWETIADLGYARYNHFMFEIDGHVHVGGGYTSQGRSAHWVEYYDTVRNCWELVQVNFGWPWTCCVQWKRDDSVEP